MKLSISKSWSKAIDLVGFSVLGYFGTLESSIAVGMFASEVSPSHPSSKALPAHLISCLHLHQSYFHDLKQTHWGESLFRTSVNLGQQFEKWWNWACCQWCKLRLEVCASELAVFWVCSHHCLDQAQNTVAYGVSLVLLIGGSAVLIQRSFHFVWGEGSQPRA